MKWAEIFEKEKRHKQEELYLIHFYKEDNLWWRASEWSAYLCYNFPNNLEEKYKIKPNKKLTNENENGLIQVGLQAASFPKYLPDIEAINVDEKEMLFDAKEFFKDKEFTIENYEKILNVWKNKFPFKERKIKENNIKNDDTINDFNSKSGALNIISELIHFQIEKSSMLQIVEFLCDIKRKAINLF